MVPRLLLYGLASTSLAGIVIGSALKTRPNFYSASVAVGRSSGALMVLANFALFNIICFGIAVKTIFFGQLRAIEYEHLFERSWLFVTESLLALTIFRDDFSIPFIIMYGLLLFLKCFHWITADRVDYMDQIPPPGPPLTFHLRTASIIFFLTALDLILVSYSLETILVDGVSAMVLFASEFMILLASVSGTMARYIVGLIDLRRARGRADAPSWEEKSMYLFYIDLAVDFAKLLTYLSFFAVILLHYGLPLHILRDVYMTLRSFLTRVGDLIRYRRATRDMDALYPNATVEEMERLGDKTCIICREEMVVRLPGDPVPPGGEEGGPNETPKRLACGHVFHFHCLRSWLERQQSCPTCRRDVLRTPAQTHRARQTPPVAAPAAPGAVPQPAGNGNANQAVPTPFEQYFRLPPQPAATPTPQPSSNVAGQPTTTHGETDEHRIQRGIWGGRITPGQFFPTPLGAAPRLTSHLSSPGPSRLPSRIASSSSRTARSTSPPERNNAALQAANAPLPVSGSHTPATSNPPEIFSSTSVNRLEGIAALDARRAAAEAALRRFGSSPVTTSGTISTDSKGKAPEVVAETLETQPLHTPYLSSNIPTHGASPSASWKTVENGSRDSIEDRLRVLRDVDEVLWGLVGDLTRAKSAWEAEDAGAGLRREPSVPTRPSSRVSERAGDGAPAVLEDHDAT
ncbi:hypothetical protein BCR39DRAFT_537671 [Naematelia encephala]|uniref:RING-type E3 ubiquitin transferase n=1 Tax=Naematelia encephala TaxID=71784 RepID=A0A1Y2AYK0_9TREE|nr:hypothetical protein BCR39DRAFT_537671 [Naematelia encephala]